MKAILFDYDGTLALTNEDLFARNYFEHLNSFMKGKYSVAISSKDVLECVEYIIKNADGERNNFVRFLDCFSSKTKENIEWMKAFQDFYSSEDFESLKDLAVPNEKIIELLHKSKAKGLKTVLATNPVFPEIAIVRRLHWIGLTEADFDLITTMENFFYCKPHPQYFLQICKILNVEPEDCIMIGNDDHFDKPCENVGIVFKHVTEVNEDWIQNLLDYRGA